MAGFGQIFGDIAGGIGRGVLALGTGGISEYQRGQLNDVSGILNNPNMDYGQKIASLNQLGSPLAAQEAIKMSSPSLAAQQWQSLSPEQQQAYVASQNPLTPSQRLNAQVEMYKANPLINNPPDLGPTTTGSPTSQPAGNQPAASGGVDPKALTGDEFLSYLSKRMGPGFANSVKAVAEGRESPPTPGSKGNMASLLNQAVAQYKPDFDFANASSNFKNRQATETEFTKGDAAKNVRSIGTASNHLAKLVSQVPGVSWATPIGDFPLWNAAQNFIATETGHKGASLFNQTADALSSELGAVYKGSGHNSDTEIANMRKSLSANASDDQKYGALENALELMAGRGEELAQQYNRGINAQPGDANYKTYEDFLSPSAKKNIAKAKETIQAFKMKQAGVNSNASTPAPTQAKPQASKVIGGKTYHLINGQWYQ